MATHLMWLLRALLLLLLSVNVCTSQSLIRTLPGFPGDLPFKLETGYVGVGEWEEVQLFYYFIQSEEGDPAKDPLILWLTGGPGCSGFFGLVYEIGPLTLNTANFDGKFPKFVLNPYSWTKVANIIFLDSPVGTGFSYATTPEGYITNDTLSTAQTYEFLRKWLMNHPEFLLNPLYVAGDSYSGLIVPIVAQRIHNGNKAGLRPEINLQGYVLGNPVTDEHSDLNSRIPFAHRMALISDELYMSMKRSCNGDYVDDNPSNAQCMSDRALASVCTSAVNQAQILEPKCDAEPRLDLYQRSTLPAEDNVTHFLYLPTELPKFWCREENHLLSSIWANDERVRHALHIREGTIKEWQRCNMSLSLSYTQDVWNTVDYHRNLTKAYRALVYSGDHDMLIPHVGTEAWIRSLNLTVYDDWRPWFVDGQSGGFTVAYLTNSYLLTYATVKGGGHTAPEFRPKECFAMIDRWLSAFPL